MHRQTRDGAAIRRKPGLSNTWRAPRTSLHVPPPWPGPRHPEEGTAAVEFALVAPLLATILIAVVEIGFSTRQQMQAQDSAAAGALYAAQNGWNSAGISAAVTGAIAYSNVSASPAPLQFFGCPSSTGVAGGKLQTTICPDGLAARHYVLVSAAVTRTSFLPSSLPLLATLTATATTRIP